MGEIFAVTSGKGGVGKSTVAVGLATAFCRMNQKVLLVDMDEGLRCLDLLLDIDDSAVYDLCDALEGADPDDVAYECEEENLFLIPAPASIGKIDPEKLKIFAEKVLKLFDIVIFDFPAGLDFSLYTCLPAKTLFLTVAVPDPVSVRDAAAVSTRLYECELKSRLIINRFLAKKMVGKKTKNIDGIIDTTTLRLLGIVPESEELGMLSLKHKLSRKDNSAKAFLRIAKRLSGEDIPLPKKI